MGGLLPKEFVSSFGAQHLHGVYTVVPTFLKREKCMLLDLEFHQERLVQSLESLLSLSGHSLKYSLDGIVTIINDSIKQDYHTGDAYGITTICLGVDNSNSLIVKNMFSSNERCNYQSMYSLSGGDSIESSFIVNTCVYDRILPTVKSCSWPIDRIPLESARSKDHSETIMCSAAQNELLLKEGLVSNLFFFHENKLLASANPILPGSMAKLVIQTAEKAGFTVEYTELSSTLLQSNYVQGVFLTSATKPIQRVTRIVDLEGTSIYDSSKHETNSCSNMNKLRQLLLYSLIHDKSLWTIL